MNELVLPPGVLEKLREDPTLTYHLGVCAADPEMLSLFLGRLAGDSGRGNAVLALSALRAYGNWLVSGRRTISDTDYVHRVEACEKCPHSGPPTEALLHRLAQLSGTSRICTICGCDVHRKARLPTESCPDVAFGPSGRWRVVSYE